MVTFVLLTLPLLAIAYGFGGVSTRLLWVSIVVIALTTLQIGAIGLFCSACCRTSVSAFVTSYLFGAVLLGTLPIVTVLNQGFPILGFRYNAWANSLLPADLLHRVMRQQGIPMTDSQIYWRLLPPTLSIVILLALTRFFFVRRAFLEPRNVLLAVFRFLDRVFKRLNDKFFDGALLIEESDTLPDEQPIAWMELTKRSLSKPQYLIRLFMVTEIPLLFLIAALVGAGGSYNTSYTLALTTFVVWVLTVLLLSVPAVNTFAGERSRQTLDVLLTIPIAGHELVRQKVRALGVFPSF